jgi:ubiquinone/menaquinone biosynthesis C-methylase UbiE
MKDREKYKIDMDENNYIKIYFKKECQNNIDFYSKKRADIYNSISKRNMWKIYKKSLEQILLDDDESRIVLDAGCGIGHFLFELNTVDSFDTIIGLDLLREPLKIAQKNEEYFDKVSFYECDLLSVCFKDNSIDIVFCLNNAHHFTKNKLKQILLELSRICKKFLVIEIRNSDFLLNFLYNPTLFSNKYKHLPWHATKISWMESFLQKHDFFLKYNYGKTSLDCLCRRKVLVFERVKD